MILCEGDCEEWFHYECLGWGEDVELDNFTCEDCLTKLHTRMVNMLTPIPKNENQKIIVECPAGRGEKIIIQSTPKKGGGVVARKMKFDKKEQKKNTNTTSTNSTATQTTQTNIQNKSIQTIKQNTNIQTQTETETNNNNEVNYRTTDVSTITHILKQIEILNNQLTIKDQYISKVEREKAKMYVEQVREKERRRLAEEGVEDLEEEVLRLKERSEMLEDEVEELRRQNKIQEEDVRAAEEKVKELDNLVKSVGDGYMDSDPTPSEEEAIRVRTSEYNRRIYDNADGWYRKQMRETKTTQTTPNDITYTIIDNSKTKNTQKNNTQDKAQSTTNRGEYSSAIRGTRC